ncbi:MAG: hypothetical protein V4772_21255, partial [Pseudomonadota bacterium]
MTARFGPVIASMEQGGFLKIWEGTGQFNESGQSSSRIEGAAQGGWDGNTAHLFAEGIPAGHEVAVLLHEVGEHASMQDMLGPDAYKHLVERAYALVRSSDPIALAAVARMPHDTRAQHLDSELLAYMIETAVAADSGASPGVRRWLADIVAAMRAWWSTTALASRLQKLGIQLELTPQDMAALAVRAVKWQGQGLGERVRATQHNRQFGGANPETRFSQAPDTHDQRKNQTDTPAFKKWYGEWQNESGGIDNGRWRLDERGRVSAIDPLQRQGELGEGSDVAIGVGNITFSGTSGPVDRDGKPVVFYHGTRDDITAFRTDHPNRKDKGWLGRGIYVASNPDDAHTYASMKIGSGNPRIMPLFVAVRHPYIASRELKNKLKHSSQAAIDAFTADLKAKGHDGVVMAFDEGHVELMAFEPTQVKSAIGNNGNFDGTNPDIRYSRPAIHQSNVSSAQPGAAARQQNTTDTRADGPNPPPAPIRRSKMAEELAQMDIRLLAGGLYDP